MKPRLNSHKKATPTDSTTKLRFVIVKLLLPSQANSLE